MNPATEPNDTSIPTILLGHVAAGKVRLEELRPTIPASLMRTYDDLYESIANAARSIALRARQTALENKRDYEAALSTRLQKVATAADQMARRAPRIDDRLEELDQGFSALWREQQRLKGLRDSYLGAIRTIDEIERDPLAWTDSHIYGNYPSLRPYIPW